MAIPGSTVNVGRLVTPSGAQGPQGVIGSTGGTGPTGPTGATGPPSVTTTTSVFTVPPIGATTTVNVANPSWIVIGELLYVSTAGGTTSAGALQVTAINGNTITLLNPNPPSVIPPADSTQAGLLNQVSGNTTDFVDGTNHSQALSPVIWYARQRSFNAIGNPNFEIDQRNVGTGIVNIAASAFAIDRWQIAKVGTHTVNTQQEAGSVFGYNFCYGQNRLLLQLITTEASLGAGDYIQLVQTIEGPVWREISNYPFSISLYVYSDVALKFALAIRGGSLSLVKLCTVPAATWTLVTLPNIPAPTTAFPLTPGTSASSISITLSCGTTYIAPTADTWVSGNYIGAPGMDNWSSKATGSGFRIGFVQLEPGPLCSIPIDKPFTANYDECLRYFQKSYAYSARPGATGIGGGMVGGFPLVSGWNMGTVRFVKPMAKAPTVTYYNPQNGAANGIYGWPSATNYSVGQQTPWGVSTTGWEGWNIGASPAYVAGDVTFLHYTADTGW